MKKTTPEKTLARFWLKANREYWLSLANQAPTVRHHRLYLAQLLPEWVAVNELTEVHAGQKSETMYCPSCLEEYTHVSIDHAAYCAAGHPPVQVRPAKHIVAVSEAVQRFQVKNKCIDEVKKCLQSRSNKNNNSKTIWPHEQ